MDQTQTPEALKTETTARRVFLAQVGRAAVTAPAVALLLSASATPAAAAYAPGGQTGDNGPRRKKKGKGGRGRHS